MDVRRKNQIGLIGFAVLIAAGAVYAGWTYWPHTGGKDVTAALNADISSMGPADIRMFVERLPLDRMTEAQKFELYQKLRARVEAMPMSERMRLFQEAGPIVQKNPEGPLAKNGEQLMRLGFRDMMESYAKLSPDERSKLLDQRIDEQLRMETLRKAATMAGKLFGASSQPATQPTTQRAGPGGAMAGGRNWRDSNEVRGHIADMVGQSMLDGDPQFRASAAQYFTDMRKRRQQRGLENPW
ncbi:MAG: hypothetical protein WCJ97_06775 [Phycisphaerae bacterium]